MNRDTYLKEGQIPDHLRPDPPLTLPPLPEHLKGKSMTQTTSSYIPTISTPFIMSPELNVGERWYVKFPEARALTEVVIDEITLKTVVIIPTKKYSPPGRYKKSDIEFVEKVEEKLSTT